MLHLGTRDTRIASFSWSWEPISFAVLEQKGFYRTEGKQQQQSGFISAVHMPGIY
jgi:hypothetical protein